MLFRKGQAYSQDLRERVFALSDAGHRVGEIAEALCVSISYVSKALSRRDVPGTLKSARHHASNRQVITLETGTPSRSKSAPDHAAIRHVFRRLWGTHLSEVSAVQ